MLYYASIIALFISIQKKQFFKSAGSFIMRDKLKMDATYKYYLNKIKCSIAFRKKEKCYLLLCYFETMIEIKKEHMISEKTIAFDALNKDHTFDPNNDSSVRVLLYRFKKQLNQYYLSEGLNDEIALSIQNGSYTPIFHKNKSNSNIDPLIPRKKLLEEQILLSFSLQFSLTTDEYYLDKIIDFYNQIDEDISRKSSYILAIVAETIINKNTLFNSNQNYTMTELESLIEKANSLNKADEQVIFTNIVYALSTQNSMNLKKQIDLMESNANQPYFLALAYMANGLLTSDERCIKGLNSILDSFNFHPPYWHVPNMLASMRNNDNISAMYSAQKMNKSPSFLSKIYITIIKAKTSFLNKTDEIFISENEYFFTESYLRNSLFEQANKYALL